MLKTTGRQRPLTRVMVEGAILALSLAESRLETALDMAGQLAGGHVNEAFEVPFAAWSIVRDVVARLECSVLAFDQDRAMDSILSASRPRARALEA